MSNRDIKLLLEDMLESALKIKRYTTNLDYDSFVNDDKTIDAVVRNFEIIGEAANRIDHDFRITNSKIEWIEQGLQYFVNNYKEWNISSISFPMLGCGLGGLKWEKVKPLMEKYLKDLDIEVEIYEL